MHFFSGYQVGDNNNVSDARTKISNLSIDISRIYRVSMKVDMIYPTNN